MGREGVLKSSDAWKMLFDDVVVDRLKTRDVSAWMRMMRGRQQERQERDNGGGGEGAREGEDREEDDGPGLALELLNPKKVGQCGFLRCLMFQLNVRGVSTTPLTTRTALGASAVWPDVR